MYSREQLTVGFPSRSTCTMAQPPYRYRLQIRNPHRRDHRRSGEDPADGLLFCVAVCVVSFLMLLAVCYERPRQLSRSSNATTSSTAIRTAMLPSFAAHLASTAISAVNAAAYHNVVGHLLKRCYDHCTSEVLDFRCAPEALVLYRTRGYRPQRELSTA